MTNRVITCARILITFALCATAPLSAQTKVPRYEADLTWPKPLPQRWILGGLGGVCVDRNDHVVILNRQDVLDGELSAGQLAPPIIEFDAAGNVVHSWGDLKVLDPRLHSCAFDKENNMWIASAPSGMVQKYTHDGGKLLMQLGEKGVFDSSDGTAKGTPLNSPAAKFFMPSSLFVDPANGDLYVADGEGRNADRRIAVFDKQSKFLRHWVLEDQQSLHCMAVAHDGLMYLCDREGARVQVYDKSGKFIRTFALPWTPTTPPADGKAKDFGGAVVAIDFSADSAQTYLYVINQNNGVVDVVERETGKKLTSFGRVGRFPGNFDQPHGIAVDSKGYIYIADNRGKKVTRFKPVK